MDRRTRTLRRTAAALAVTVGLVGGGYGVASAASGSGTGTAPQYAPGSGQPQGQPFGPQRSDETPLTGDALTQATAAAKAKVPGGTVVRAETDADGVAKYEVHMRKADGTPVTVYLDASFAVTSVASP